MASRVEPLSRLPQLRRSHRFGSANGVPLSVIGEDRFRNCLIGRDAYQPDEAVLAAERATLNARAKTSAGRRTEKDKHVKNGKQDKKDRKRDKEATVGMAGDRTAPEIVAALEAPRASPKDDVRIGILTPTHRRPDRIRALAMQMALQEKTPDVLCIHQNGDPKSYEWAVADLPLPFAVNWIHTPEKIAQDEWYSRPLKALLDDGCTHFFWCDDDDIYRSDHVARSMTMLTDTDEPYDFVVNGYSGMVFLKKDSYHYDPCVRFEAHAAGGMSSSMAFNRAFAADLLQDLRDNRGKLHYADQVVKLVTMPKFRCKLDEEPSPSTIYVCHPGADSSAHWLGDTTHNALDELGLKYQTDKASSYHDYLVHYDELLAPLRSQPFDMLEIGVASGASIRMWHDYFPAARIVGVDVEPFAFEPAELPRFTFLRGSQADPVFLHQLVQQFDFRLVVDDGSHYWAHQIFTFQAVFPLLAPGSVYVCEDIQTSFGGHVAQYQAGARESAAAYFLRLAQFVAAAEEDPVRDNDDALLHAIVTKIKDVMFFRHCVIVRC